jgi:hypothetical protein
MEHSRLSIAGLLAIILAAAIGIACLSRPSCLAASAMFSLLLTSLAVALIGVLYRGGERRAFWTGFLACGTLYAVLSLAPWFDRHVSHRLITTAMLDILYPKMPPLEYTADPQKDAWTSWTGRPRDYNLAHPRVGFTMGTTDEFHEPSIFRVSPFTTTTTDAFLSIGHSLFAMLVAVGGGRLAVHFHEPRN